MTAHQLVTRLDQVSGGALKPYAATRPYRCSAAGGPRWLPSCPRTPIKSGDVIVAYVGEAVDRVPPLRYHPACALTAWATRPVAPRGRTLALASLMFTVAALSAVAGARQVAGDAGAVAVVGIVILAVAAAFFVVVRADPRSSPRPICHVLGQSADRR